MQRLVAKLFKEPTEEDYRQLKEDSLKERRDKKMMTMLYDPADKKHQSYSYCMRKYGKDLADKMLWAKNNNNGRLESSDYSAVLRIRNNAGKATPPKRNDKKTEKTDKQFIGLTLSLLRSENFRHKLRKGLMLYLYIRSAIVRKKFPGDRLNLSNRYYKKGNLAASISIRKLAKDLGLNTKTVHTYLKDLERNGAIKIDKIRAKDAYDNQIHCVYVLGTYSDKRNENYFVDRLVDE
jgi:hypothetical protein